MLHCETDARMLLVTVLQTTTACNEILIVSEVRLLLLLLLRPASTSQTNRNVAGDILFLSADVD